MYVFYVFMHSCILYKDKLNMSKKSQYEQYEKKYFSIVTYY